VVADPVRVLVPLCGKTLDMAYLAGIPAVSQVVGVDVVSRALDVFAKEHPYLALQEVPDSAKKENEYHYLQGSKISLLLGDFFALNDTITNGRFEAVVDRGSLVAINPTLREAYVDVMGRLIKPGGKILLITIERVSDDLEYNALGPPFSVSESQVRGLYEKQDWVKSVTMLTNEYVDERNSVRHMLEHYFLIQAH
jgi:thiopurine S-methyltransferase